MRSFAKIFIVMILVCMLGACTTTGSTTGTQGTSGEETRYQEPDYYLDFDDIMIPKEITYQEDESYKLDNSKFRAGIMKFTGRVEVIELVQYFLNNMAKDNWTLVSNNKASSVQVLNFEKRNKSCVIHIDDSFATCHTTIFAVEVKDCESMKKN